MIYLIVFIVFVLEVQHSPRIEQTRERDVLLFYTYRDKREFIKLFTL